MTEAEWLSCGDPDRLIPLVTNAASGRRLRLFACASCRLFWNMIVPFSEIRACVEFAEGYVDGAGAKKRLKKLVDANEERFRWYGGKPGEDLAVAHLASAARLCCDPTPPSLTAACRQSGWAAGLGLMSSHPEQAALLRDIFGNPFRPVVADPRWLTPTVVAMAGGIYADLAFDRLPVLADALMDAGCDDADVLAHCRGDGPHVRGCWVVDLILGKT